MSEDDDFVVYDKADWHLNGDFPEDLTESSAYIHSGFLLGWFVMADLVSDEALEDFSDEIASFRKREITAPQLFEACDGCFSSDMLTRAGNSFAGFYASPENDRYMEDYVLALADALPSVYHVADNWENFEKISKVISERFRAWESER